MDKRYLGNHSFFLCVTEINSDADHFFFGDSSLIFFILRWILLIANMVHLMSMSMSMKIELNWLIPI